jgi:hypothetical protein
MSKLRADITWKHRIHSDSSVLISPFNIITDKENQMNDDIENPENVEDIEDSILKESDEEEADSDNLEKEFGDYLQGWAEMLDEETLKFQNEENEIDELDEISINDTIHPAIDPNAKWNLESLFNNLELPF